MMPFLLLALGLLLIFLEFYLPGAIMGIAGTALVIASIILYANQAESAGAVIAFTTGVLVLLGFLIRFALKRIRGTAKDNTMYLDTDQSGYTASSYDVNAIGKNGVVYADLKPAGHIMIAGVQYQATTESGYLPRGTPIVVIGGSGAHLIVKPINKDITT